VGKSFIGVLIGARGGVSIGTANLLYVAEKKKARSKSSAALELNGEPPARIEKRGNGGGKNSYRRRKSAKKNK